MTHCPDITKIILLDVCHSGSRFRTLGIRISTRRGSGKSSSLVYETSNPRDKHVRELFSVSLQLSTMHFSKYLLSLGTKLVYGRHTSGYYVHHLGRSVGTLAGPRSQPLSLGDAPPTLGESLAGGALLVPSICFFMSLCLLIAPLYLL
jgi:hypothetical protein